MKVPYDSIAKVSLANPFKLFSYEHPDSLLRLLNLYSLLISEKQLELAFSRLRSQTPSNISCKHWVTSFVKMKLFDTQMVFFNISVVNIINVLFWLQKFTSIKYIFMNFFSNNQIWKHHFYFWRTSFYPFNFYFFVWVCNIYQYIFIFHYILGSGKHNAQWTLFLSLRECLFHAIISQ